MFKVKKQQEEEKPALIPYEVHADENNEEVEEAAEAQQESSQDLNSGAAVLQDQENSSGVSNDGNRGFPNLVGFIPPVQAEKPILLGVQ